MRELNNETDRDWGPVLDQELEQDLEQRQERVLDRDWALVLELDLEQDLQPSPDLNRVLG